MGYRHGANGEGKEPRSAPVLRLTFCFAALQEKLLEAVKDELKEIKEQLTAITISLGKKSRRKNDNEKNETKDKKNKYRITLSHREARRFAREWFETRTLKKDEKKRKIAQDAIEKYGSYSYNIHQDSSDLLSESSSNDESRNGGHSD
eukprot:scaffold12459_cov56-Attheya_sp.AAC.1